MARLTEAPIETAALIARLSPARALDALGVLTRYAADVVPPVYDPATLAYRGHLVEDAATNLASNPEWAGAIAGTPGTLPTSVGTSGTVPAGITREVAVGTEDGIPWWSVRYYGTAATESAFRLRLAQVTASAGDVARAAVQVSRPAGSLAGISGLSVQLRDVESSTGPSLTINPTSAPLRTQLFRPGGLAQDIVTAGEVRLDLAWTWLAGIASDITLRVGAPLLQLNTPIGSPIYTEGGARERARTQFGFDPSRFLLYASPRLGVAAGDVLLHLHNPAVQQVLWQAHDGTDANRIVVLHTAAREVVAIVIKDGVEAARTAAAATLVDGAPTGWAVTWSDGVVGGSPYVALSVNGGPVRRVTLAAGGLPAVDRSSIGMPVGAGGGMHGVVPRHWLDRSGPDDATLRSYAVFGAAV